MATPTIYDWKRLWYPLDAPLPVGTGFLTPNPDDQGAALPDLADAPCLVLLGAPGMGKSFEARLATDEARGRGEAVDLVQAQLRRDLSATLADLLSSEHAIAWREQGKSWSVIVDGIDELANGAASFGEGLQRFLSAAVASGGDLKNLRLRLFCRTVEWAKTLEQTLEAFWLPTELQKRQLAPLSREDVRKAADAELGATNDAERFVQAVEDVHAEALAAKPVALKMLLRLFEQHRELPKRQALLFQRGIAALLEDPRARRGGTPPHNVETLMILAGRIATAMAVSGAGAVTIGDAHGVEVKGGVISLASLAEGFEPIPPYSVAVRYQDLLEVIRSALFDPLGADTYVWSHQTFMEYLAGRYLVAHELDAVRLLDFLTIADPDGGPGGIAPQLREVAAWSATLAPEVFDALLAREPDVLLQSDVAAAEPGAQERLVAALLDRLEFDELADRFWRLRNLLSRLKHSRLEEQLRTVLLDADKPVSARRGAIDIAEETGAAALTADFVDLARDTTAPIVLRRDAAGAVSLLGDAANKRDLSSILAAEGDVLDDEIKGTVLQATWPHLLPIGSLLNALTPPKDPSFIGVYSTFLYRLDPGALSADEALQVVEWIAPRLEDRGEASNFSMRRAVARLFWAAVAQSHDPDVRRAIAKLLNVAFDKLSQAVLEDDDLRAAWPAEAADRAALVIAALQQADDPVRTGRYLHHFAPKLVSPDDLGSYLKAYSEESNAKTREALADLIVTLATRLDIDGLSDLFELTKTDTTLESAWNAAFYIELTSPSVEWLRAGAQREAEARTRQAAREAALARSDEAVADYLASIEGGAADEWWKLNLQLFVGDDGRFEGGLEFQSDLTATPGWKRLSTELQSRIVDAAERYLLHARPPADDWLTAKTHSRPAAAGYRALRLLHDVAPERFGALDGSVWRQWAPATLWFFDNDANAAHTVQTKIVAQAYEKARQAVGQALETLARAPGSEGLTDRTLEVLQEAYDEDLAKTLNSLRDERLQGSKSDELIVRFLVKAGYAPLVEELKEKLFELTQSDVARSKSLPDGFADAISELMAASHQDVWAMVEDLAELDAAFAREVWEHLASDYSYRNGPDLKSIDADLLAQAYVDLYNLFPDRPDRVGGARFLAAVDFVDRLRGSILNHLVARGSVEALGRIAEVAADDGWALRNMPDARQSFRAKAAGSDATEALRRIALLGPTYPPLDPVEAASAPTVSEPPLPPPTEPKAPITPITILSSVSGPELGSRVLRLVFVATEWSSSKGGVSTLNRELCVALAKQGHRVHCVVVDASEEETAQAGRDGVTLIIAPIRPGLGDNRRLLLLDATHFAGLQPDAVIGHDQVTGAYAYRLAEILGAPYVHFLHTVPEEIEPHKGRTRGVGAAYRGYTKLQAQQELCEHARLIVGIGPRITSNAPVAGDVHVHEMIPGFNLDLLTRKASPPRRPHCLITGRMEDADLKGLPIACATVGKIGPIGPNHVRPSLIVRGLEDDIEDQTIQHKTGLSGDEWRNLVKARPFTTDVKDLYTDLDMSSLVLMPSLAEGFGLTGFEALAAGRPILISQESGLAEWLMRLARAGDIEQSFVETCVADVTAEATRTQLWVDRTSSLLNDQVAAFDRAKRIRDTLKATYTWQRAAVAFVEDLLRVVDSAP